jgi:hypothetical protein
MKSIIHRRIINVEHEHSYVPGRTAGIWIPSRRWWTQPKHDDDAALAHDSSQSPTNVFAGGSIWFNDATLTAVLSASSGV